jgi:hypothetical protein
MPEGTGIRTDLTRRFAAPESRVREAKEIEGRGADLSLAQILAWADAHHAAHGAWPAVGPRMASEEVIGAPGESWKAINQALALGLRGLPGDSSLAHLLAEHRGAPPPVPKSKRRGVFPARPRLSVTEILAWADAHQAATGDWPVIRSGPVRAAPYDISWKNVDDALRLAHRGLPGGSSLGQVLREHRNVLAPLTVERILAWADAHHAATGRWPNYLSGKVLGVPGENWCTLDNRLKKGGRGLPGGSSLARLLAGRRAIRAGKKIEPLSVGQILAWADAYHATHGRWPDTQSGPVAPGLRLTWSSINGALTVGRRGLPGGTTLFHLLLEHRGPNIRDRPAPMTVEQVLAWADAYHEATGRWPSAHSGPVTEAPHVTWSKIDNALRHGIRGLPGNSSLPQFLARNRGVVHGGWRPPLTVEQIMAWADAFHTDHGHWPTRDSGPIPGTRCETWNAIDKALATGRRGLPRIASLRRLIVEQRSGFFAPPASRGAEPPETELLAQKIKDWERTHFPAQRPQRPCTPAPAPALTIELILAWADAHHAAAGNWPTRFSGRVEAAPFELTWSQVADALRRGRRGLPGGRSIRSVLVEHRNLAAQRSPRVLSIEQILDWADAYHAAHGRWPSGGSGPVSGAPGERWSAITSALRDGRYGLPGGTTLRRLIAEHRDPVARLRFLPMTVDQILAWMDQHRAAHGRWPSRASGPVPAEPGLTWSIIDRSLRSGYHGVGPGLSLAQLRRKHRGADPPPPTRPAAKGLDCPVTPTEHHRAGADPRASRPGARLRIGSPAQQEAFSDVDRR